MPTAEHFENEKKLAVSDILSQHFYQVITEKELNVEQVAKKAGDPWWQPVADIIKYKDGSYTEVTRNLLQEWLNGEVFYVPRKEHLERLEESLGQPKHSIATVCRADISEELFLVAHGLMVGGYKNEDFHVTQAFEKNRLVKKYRAEKAKEAKELAKRRAAQSKAQAKAAKEHRDYWFTKLKRVALGKWGRNEIFDNSPAGISDPSKDKDEERIITV